METIQINDLDDLKTSLEKTLLGKRKVKTQTERTLLQNPHLIRDWYADYVTSSLLSKKTNNSINKGQIISIDTPSK